MSEKDKGFKTVNRIFRDEVNSAMKMSSIATDIITDEYVSSLPIPLQNYFRYTGWIGRKVVNNFSLTFEGDFKMGLDKNWIKIKSVQYNFSNPASRFFKISGSVFAGRDKYESGRGEMLIKILSLLKVVDAVGPEMDQSALVTFFNDACLMAPGMLPVLDIRWEGIDASHVKGTIRDSGMEVSAILEFNKTGELVDFLTYDRYMSAKGDKYDKNPWSTPVKDYKLFDGIKAPSYGEGIHHLPGGHFIYARFRVAHLSYNNQTV